MTQPRSENLESFLDTLRDSGGFKNFDDISERAWSDDTALHMAVRFFENEVVSELIDLGIDINAQGDMKQTPLHVAVSINNLEMAELLIDRGASLTSIDELHCQPPFFSALLSEQDEMLNLLFRKVLGEVRDADEKRIWESWVEFHDRQKCRHIGGATQQDESENDSTSE